MYKLPLEDFISHIPLMAVILPLFLVEPLSALWLPEESHLSDYGGTLPRNVIR